MFTASLRTVSFVCVYRTGVPHRHRVTNQLLKCAAFEYNDKRLHTKNGFDELFQFRNLYY